MTINGKHEHNLLHAARGAFVPNYAPAKIVLHEGRGCRVRDTDGNEYIDLGCGIGVNSLGHCNPDVIEAVRRQVERLLHVSNLYYSEPPIALAQRLIDHSFAECVFLCNSGSEANEAAIKLARKYASVHLPPAQRNILSFSGSFHGRTLATVCATANPGYQQGFEPLPAGFTYCAMNDFAAAEQAVDKHTCAVLIEPLQGEGGVYPAAPGFLAHLRTLCDRHGALLIVDEIQCGIGRTGKLFAHEWQEGLRPDIMTLAKALGGGLPIGAMLARAEVAAALQPGSHGSTFGGNPVACAAACAVFDQVNEQALLDKVPERGAVLCARLHEINEAHGVFREIRGRGLMVGAELAAAHHDKAAAIIDRCRRHGVLVLSAGPGVLRFLPPLNISDSELDEGMARVAAAVTEFAESGSAGSESDADNSRD